jgi:hypothetical protein
MTVRENVNSNTGKRRRRLNNRLIRRDNEPTLCRLEWTPGVLNRNRIVPDSMQTQLRCSTYYPARSNTRF